MLLAFYSCEVIKYIWFPSGSAQHVHWRHVLIAFFQIKMVISPLPLITRLKVYCWSKCILEQLHLLSVHHNQQR